jgi:cyanophycin synthetase
LVASTDQALKAAEALGYPVVVKPANLDGGLGVSAGVRNANSLVRAYGAAAKLSASVLVEEFVEGNDYRFRVCKNQVIGVVARRPASIVGNGVDTVIDLIEQVNKERALTKTLNPEIEMGIKPITIDDEVHEWLTHQGVDLQSTIDSGQRIRLRGAANIMLGGTTWDVMRIAHPDNLALAVQAVQSLRLDIAGVDVLHTDITQSWQQVGAAICEVNGQPQLPKGHVHQQVLELLVSQKGRIPVVAIESEYFGPSEADSLKNSPRLNGLKILMTSDLVESRRGLESSDVNGVVILLKEFNHNTSWPFDVLDLLICSREMSQRLTLSGVKANDECLVDGAGLQPNWVDVLLDGLTGN